MTKEENWVYTFKMRYFGPEKTANNYVHNHSGLIIANTLKEAFDKIYNEYHDVYVDALEDDEEDAFDIDFITISQYSKVTNGIIRDEEDEYYGI